MSNSTSIDFLLTCIVIVKVLFILKISYYIIPGQKVDTKFHKLCKLIVGNVGSIKVPTLDNVVDMIANSISITKSHHCMKLTNVYLC